MRLLFVLAVSLLLSLPGGACAASRESVDAMFSEMGMATAWDANLAAMQQALDQHAHDGVPAPSPEEQRRFDAMMARLWPLMRSELGWRSLGAEVSQMYADVFTQDEIDAMLAFYASPEGRAIIAKMPQAVAVAMQGGGDLLHDGVLTPSEAAAFEAFNHSATSESMKAKFPLVRERIGEISRVHRLRMRPQMEQIIRESSMFVPGAPR